MPEEGLAKKGHGSDQVQFMDSVLVPVIVDEERQRSLTRICDTGRRLRRARHLMARRRHTGPLVPGSLLIALSLHGGSVGWKFLARFCSLPLL